MMTNCVRERAVGSEEGSRSRERKAVGQNLVKVRKDVVAKRDGDKARRRKTGNRRREESDLAQTHGNPTARVDSIVVQSGGSRSHQKAPRSETEMESKVREGDAAIEISREGNEEKESGELELRG
jgi:hypothetical protein